MSSYTSNSFSLRNLDLGFRGTLDLRGFKGLLHNQEKPQDECLFRFF